MDKKTKIVLIVLAVIIAEVFAYFFLGNYFFGPVKYFIMIYILLCPFFIYKQIINLKAKRYYIEQYEREKKEKEDKQSW